MRIFIDAVPLLVRSAGVKNYLFHWIVHLRRLLGDEQVRLFPFLDRLPALDHEGSAADAPGTLARQALLFALNLWPNRFADLMAPPDGIFHATKLLYPPRHLRLTATLHDLTCWLLPEFHQPANVAAEKRFAERIWKRADGLIAVSESTRRDAVKILDLNPDAIHVIYPGVAEPFFEATAETSVPARLKYGLRRPYALYVGTVEPRKNVDLLLDAWQTLRRSVAAQFDLVIAGPEGWQSTGTLARLRVPAPGVRYLGYVPEPDLPGITAGATVFVYPSLYEGFGFPVAQAMAAGVPVITSGLSSLPEVTGGAARLIDPHSAAELRAALDSLLTSPATCAQLAAAGRIQAERFRWESCARRSVQFFEQVTSAQRLAFKPPPLADS
ncbi:MAG TPA: glycosyltransferase family 1 protein [Bryobacteraceae bacterium]|nr:glycosyltransferase family 1 protein [Bryobacteraceae bacterium]